jgi:hypothetical protein
MSINNVQQPYDVRRRPVFSRSNARMGKSFWPKSPSGKAFQSEID